MSLDKKGCVAVSLVSLYPCRPLIKEYHTFSRGGFYISCHVSCNMAFRTILDTACLLMVLKRAVERLSLCHRKTIRSHNYRSTYRNIRLAFGCSLIHIYGIYSTESLFGNMSLVAYRLTIQAICKYFWRQHLNLPMKSIYILIGFPLR